ncbi:MAG: response regulator [Lachnospiraceae bacterium]|nr:response regulator [Lachnospiraceae bacterium]
MGEKKDKKILVVDDMVFTRSVVRGILKNNGYENVIEAGSAKEAVMKTVDEKPDLVILDVNLPDCDDLSTLRLIYEVNPKQDVVVSSAVNQHIVINEAKNLGIRDYLVKPFTQEQFDASVKAILEE